MLNSLLYIEAFICQCIFAVKCEDNVVLCIKQREQAFLDLRYQMQ